MNHVCSSNFSSVLLESSADPCSTPIRKFPLLLSLNQIQAGINSNNNTRQ